MASSPEVQAFLNALLDGPALAPPPGVTPDFVNPSNLNALSGAVEIICLVLATLAVCMRMYTKSRIIREVVLEDYVCVLGWAAFMGYYVPVFSVSHGNIGMHQWDVRLKDLWLWLYNIRIGAIMCGITDFMIRLSISLQYLRIFAPIRRDTVVFWGSHILIWSNFVFYVIISFFEIFACSPIEKAWNPLIINGQCFNIFAIYVAAGALNTVSNFIILCLPHSVIWKLQMSKRRKLGISALFLAGIFACTSSVAGLYYRIRVFQTGDITHYGVVVANWSYPELTSGIIVACLPVLPRFIHALAQQKCISMTNIFFRSILSSVMLPISWRLNNHHKENHTASPWNDMSDAKGWHKLDTASVQKISDVTNSVSLDFAESGPRIVRAIHIATLTECRDAMDLENESGGTRVSFADQASVHDRK